MFKKVGKRAEVFATRLPRRAFFGKVARAALPVTAALSGLLVLPDRAEAREGGCCCPTPQGGGGPLCYKRGSSCPPDLYACPCGRFPRGLPSCS
jgi:hypothetical protein